MGTLKASNGLYVVKIGNVLSATGTDPKAPEAQLALEPQDGGKVALKQGGVYWSAQRNGELQCNRPSAGPWELFTRLPGERAGSVALRSVQWGTVVSVRMDLATKPLLCKMAVAHSDESFDLSGATGEVRPLHVEGRFFVDDQGKRFQWRGCSDFALLAQFLRGEDITPVLQQRADLGFTVLRVFRYAAPPNPFSLDPRQYPSDYQQAIVEVTRLAAERGMLIEWTAGDAQVLGFGRAEQQANMDLVTEVLAGMPYFLEGMNEGWKNGQDLGAVAKPGGMRCVGTFENDDAVKRNAGLFQDYYNLHGTRSKEGALFPKWIWDQVWSLYDGWLIPNWRWPINNDEPMGFSDGQSDSRSNNPRHAYLLGTTANYDLGVTFHSDNGTRSELFSDVQGQCAAECVRGMKTAL